MRRLALVFFCLLAASPVWTYPEMVRHGYPNCTSCHVSPNGGGVLTEYGRGLSEEILSTWSRKDEGRFLYSIVNPPKWLSLGGDVRAVQMHMDTPMVRMGRFILMQADAEAAASYGPVTVDATLGHQYMPTYPSWTDHIISRRHFVMYRPSDQVSLRAGRFLQSFGINTPDHIIYTKGGVGGQGGLGFDEGLETYNVEGAYIGESFNVFATVNTGRPWDSQYERGLAVRGSRTFADTYQVGVSYFFGNGPESNRHIVGPYLILGFTPRFFLLAESDFQKLNPHDASSPSPWGWVSYNRLDYEWIQGVHTFVTGEYSRLDFSDTTTTGEAYGLGVQLFPRPHFEILGAWQKRRDARLGNMFYDYAYLLLHYYL